MRYVNQKQYPDIPYITKTGLEGAEREQGLTTTVATSGCGLCSAIMVLDRLLPAYDFELEDAVALSYELKEACRNSLSDMPLSIAAFLSKEIFIIS